jgi:hypothetical protein
MPKITGAFTTYDAKGNREDLSNSIYNIDPFDTPILSMSRRRNVKNRTFDWQTEFLPAVDPNNAQIEGFELVRSVSTPTARLTNVTQISKRDATVTGSQEASDAAGKGSEMGHQMAMASKVLKSDIEVILSSRQARNDGADATARKTEAVAHWLGRALDKNSTVGAAVIGVVTGLPVLATDAFAAVAGASQVPLTEIMVNDAMQKAFTNGARPSNMIVPPGIKRTVSTFQGRSSSQVLVGNTWAGLAMKTILLASASALVLFLSAEAHAGGECPTRGLLSFFRSCEGERQADGTRGRNGPTARPGTPTHHEPPTKPDHPGKPGKPGTPDKPGKPTHHEPPVRPEPPGPPTPPPPDDDGGTPTPTDGGGNPPDDDGNGHHHPRGHHRNHQGHEPSKHDHGGGIVNGSKHHGDKGGKHRNGHLTETRRYSNGNRNWDPAGRHNRW